MLGGEAVDGRNRRNRLGLGFNLWDLQLRNRLRNLMKTQRGKDTKAQRMENEISHKIIGSSIEVHRILGGPGLLESVYESLRYELTLRGS